MLLLTLVAAMLPGFMGWTAPWQQGLQLAVVAVLSAAMLFRFHRRLTAAVQEANDLARDIAGCNLANDLPPLSGRHPMALLMERLHQIHINLRAVVGDARHEIHGFGDLANSVAQGQPAVCAHRAAGLQPGGNGRGHGTAVQHGAPVCRDGRAGDEGQRTERILGAARW
jgi:hypothetical protein